jgi:hypothetical protein
VASVRLSSRTRNLRDYFTAGRSERFARNPLLWRFATSTSLFAPRLGVAYALTLSIDGTPFRVLGGSRFGISSIGADPRKCQTFAAFPAEPGELPSLFSEASRRARSTRLRGTIKARSVYAGWKSVGDNAVSSPALGIALTVFDPRQARSDSESRSSLRLKSGNLRFDIGLLRLQHCDQPL